jgi:hypothetical protein
MDLVDFAFERPDFAAHCAAELRNELSLVTEYPVLIAVDDIGENRFCFFWVFCK